MIFTCYITIICILCSELSKLSNYENQTSIFLIAMMLNCIGSFGQKTPNQVDKLYSDIVKNNSEIELNNSEKSKIFMMRLSFLIAVKKIMML